MENSKSMCRMPGCPKLRAKNTLSPYCTKHRVGYERYGHPLAKRLLPADYEEERYLISELIDRNKDHEGVIDALEKLEDILSQGRKGKSKGFLPEGTLKFVNNIVTRKPKTTSKQLLAITAGLVLLSKRQDSPIHDHRNLVYMVGYCVLAIPYRYLPPFVAPWKKDGIKRRTPTDRNRRQFGEYILSIVGVLAHNLADMVIREEHELRASMWKQSRPLKPKENRGRKGEETNE